MSYYDPTFKNRDMNYQRWFEHKEPCRTQVYIKVQLSTPSSSSTKGLHCCAYQYKIMNQMNILIFWWKNNLRSFEWAGFFHRAWGLEITPWELLRSQNSDNRKYTSCCPGYEKIQKTSEFCRSVGFFFQNQGCDMSCQIRQLTQMFSNSSLSKTPLFKIPLCHTFIILHVDDPLSSAMATSEKWFWSIEWPQFILNQLFL